jgi:N-methylhydantoinase A/oxoprolinase/acetone carboxylase beta subunit
MLSADVATNEPVRLVLSGPAAGTTGAMALAEACGLRDLTFDMGERPPTFP